MVTDAQVRKMMEEYTRHGKVSIAAMKSKMDRRTAAKYLSEGELPSQRPEGAREWRTREDPFAEDWEDVEKKLRDSPELEAKALFDDLCDEHPGRYHEGQLRTFQRRVSDWKAQEGPGKEVFFPQVHQPGDLMETDFTDMNELGVTIQGEAFDHMFCHSVLTYSNWEWGRVCRSESYLAITQGIQSTLVRVGRVPKRHRTDGTTAATHKLEKGEVGRRPFNEDYRRLMEHFGMKPETVSDPDHNGDVEALNGALKRRLKQHLNLRGSLDFESEEKYEAFIHQVLDKANRRRQKRVQEELKEMKELPISRIPLYQEKEVRVSEWSTIRVKENTYSVPSRLKQCPVKVRVYEGKVEVYFKGQKEFEVERLLGRNGCRMDYRHIIWSLVKKPAAFANYRYREELFPTTVFREAYDKLREGLSAIKADVEYLRILYKAASTMEVEVESALQLLLERGEPFTSEDVKGLLQREMPKVLEMPVQEVDMREYDEFTPEMKRYYEQQHK